jgi:hypothetical protein
MRLFASVQDLPRHCIDNTMADANKIDDAVEAFPGPMYVLPFSHLTLVVVLLADPLDMLACLHTIKFASAYVIVIGN